MFREFHTLPIREVASREYNGMLNLRRYTKALTPDWPRLSLLEGRGFSVRSSIGSPSSVRRLRDRPLHYISFDLKRQLQPVALLVSGLLGAGRLQ